MSRQPSRDSTMVSINGAYITYAHTFFAYGVSLHYTKIVQNEHYGYPDEWFPSVSATIGDRYPERSVFQVFIAITSGPRFALVLLTYLLTKDSSAGGRSSSIWPKTLLVCGLLRTFTCGGWTYVTSTDDHDWHDIFMISYLVLTIPWTIGRIYTTPANTTALSYRKFFATSFFGSIVPLIYFFVQHKVHKVAGAYTTYAFFEWALVLLDVAFDAGTYFDFKDVDIAIVDAQPGSSGSANTGGNSSSSSGLFTPASSASRANTPSYFRFTVDILNWFFFWSVLTSMPLLVWYFPLWYMGISGYEAFIVTVCSPVLLLVPGLKTVFSKAYPLAFLGQAVGIAAYLVLKPENRLAAVGLGTSFGFLALSIQFWTASSAKKGSNGLAAIYSASTFVLGLTLSSIAKLAFWTNNPIWPIMHEANGGWNQTGLIVALVTALLAKAGYATVNTGSTATTTSSTKSTPVKNTKPTKNVSNKGCSVAAGAAVGGLLFGLHTLLSDSSTMTFWVWDGYPVRGPLPVPHGIITIGTMLFGVYLAIDKPQFAGSSLFYLIGNVGAVLLYSFNEWLGYFGGLVLALNLVALTPRILGAAGKFNPGVSFGVAGLVLMLLYLGHVWVVAYAFVPGGPYLRERTDIILGLQQLTIGLGVFYGSGSDSGLPVLSSGVISHLKELKRKALVFIVFFLALSSAITFQRFHHEPPKPYHAEDKLLTAGIWTIHFGLDNDMWASETRMRDVIDELEIDVIGFLESDTQRAIMGFRDTTQQLAEQIGYYADFGPGPNKHTWGCALLSKFPILNSTHHLLPSPVGELAPAIHATLDVYGKPVDVVVFHSGQEEDVEDRRLQSLGVADIMASSSNPLILLSYLVTKPLQGNYNTYVGEHSGMNDIDPSDWDRWCEYILYKDIKRVGYARVSRSTITDTEIQVGKFVVDGEPAPHASSNEQIPEEQVPVGWRFPAMFRGQGVRGHRYHVFDEPRYFPVA